MSVLQSAPEPKKGTEPKKEVEADEPAPARAPRPMPCLKDWDFWRFLVAALGLLWDVLKTTFLR